MGHILLKAGAVALGLVVALLTVFRELLASDAPEAEDRPLQDSDLIGDYNFRTQQFDAGADPAGWYEDEP